MLKLREKEKASQKMLANASDKVNYGLNVFKNQANVKGYQPIIERKLNFKGISLGLKADFAFMQWHDTKLSHKN